MDAYAHISEWLDQFDEPATTIQTLATTSLATTSTVAHQSPSLTTLPSELQRKIFGLLPPEPSVCLGLTCRVFYDIHQETYPKVTINPRRPSRVELGALLADWVRRVSSNPIRWRGWEGSHMDEWATLIWDRISRTFVNAVAFERMEMQRGNISRYTLNANIERERSERSGERAERSDWW